MNVFIVYVILSCFTLLNIIAFNETYFILHICTYIHTCVYLLLFATFMPYAK